MRAEILLFSPALRFVVYLRSAVILVGKFLRTNSFDGDFSEVAPTLPKKKSRQSAIIIASDDDADFLSHVPPTRQSSSINNGSSASGAPIIRHLSEEEELEAAIRASLEPQQGDSSLGHNGFSEDADDVFGNGQEIRSNREKRVASEPPAGAPGAKRTKVEESSSSSRSAASIAATEESPFVCEYPQPILEGENGSVVKDCTIQLRLPNGTTLTVRERRCVHLQVAHPSPVR